jgi:hypothetical protein
VRLSFFFIDEVKLIIWLFAFAVVFGAIGAAAVFVLIRRDRKKS